VSDVKKWIDGNIDKNLLLEDVSVMAGYSKWHMQRIFKEVAGVESPRII